ncbi:hypothetical protein M2454_003091 [Aequitasia blattaphilus]|uniref:hypothetical protein n=1 Tax=Aequitasia blattaphilus TaxID=2949332 RepID=UPI003D2300C8
MNLSKNEVEILEVMWTADRPLLSTEIVELSVNKSWKDSSIHIGPTSIPWTKKVESFYATLLNSSSFSCGVI